MAEAKVKLTVDNASKEAIVVMDAITQSIKNAKEQTKLLSEQSRLFAELEKKSREEIVAVYRAYEEDTKRTAKAISDAEKAAADNIARALKQQKNDYESVVNAIRSADLERRRGNITVDQQTRKLVDLKFATDKLVLSESQRLSIEEKLYQVNQRTANSFTTLSGSLNNVGSSFRDLQKQQHAQTQASNRSQQAFVALAYIIQDLPYGIRGVANNITQLSQVLGTPIWINIAISGLTSLAVVFERRLTGGIATANSELDKFNTKSSEAGRRFASYGYGLESRAEYQMGGFGDKKLKSERGYTLTQAAFVESQIIMYEKLRDAIKDKEDATDEEKNKLKAYESNIALLNNQLASQLAYIKAINSEFAKRQKIQEDLAKQETKLLRNGSPSSIDAFSRIGRQTIVGGLDMADMRRREGGSAPVFDNVEYQKDALKELTTAYNTVFFDPVRAGFRALSDEIMNGLFGSLESLRQKFGNVGAAIIQSLNQVIAKLLETAMITSLLQVLFPGSVSLAGGFGSVFGSLLTGGKYTDVTTSGGGRTIGSISPKTVEQLATGSSMANRTQIFGETRISGNDILVVYRNANATDIRRNA